MSGSSKDKGKDRKMPHYGRCRTNRYRKMNMRDVAEYRVIFALAAVPSEGPPRIRNNWSHIHTNSIICFSYIHGINFLKQEK